MYEKIVCEKLFLVGMRMIKICKTRVRWKTALVVHRQPKKENGSPFWGVNLTAESNPWSSGTFAYEISWLDLRFGFRLRGFASDSRKDSTLDVWNGFAGLAICALLQFDRKAKPRNHFRRTILSSYLWNIEELCQISL